MLVDSRSICGLTGGAGNRFCSWFQAFLKGYKYMKTKKFCIIYILSFYRNCSQEFIFNFFRRISDGSNRLWYLLGWKLRSGCLLRKKWRSSCCIHNRRWWYRAQRRLVLRIVVRWLVIILLVIYSRVRSKNKWNHEQTHWSSSMFSVFAIFLLSSSRLTARNRLGIFWY